MPRKTSQPTEDAWAKLIREELTAGTIGKPEGEGWKHAGEFAQENGLQRTRAQQILRDLTAAGKVECVRAKLGQHWVKFYRPLHKAE